MDVIGALEGADKSSVVAYAWDYLRHYESLFTPFRDQPINLIEVGVQGGPSLRLWKWFFPRAQIIGIDIDPACAALAEERVSIKIGSQADAAFLKRICTATPPTIFIDDGSHLAQHNIFTFEYVFPMLLAGGIYIVEDLAFHFGASAPKWQGPQKRNAPGYFLDLARCRMARQEVPGQEHVAKSLLAQIDSVAFIDSAAVIRKRHTARDTERAYAAAQDYIAARNLAAPARQRLASYLLRHQGDLVTAEAEARASLAGGAPRIGALVTLAEILLALNRQAEAAEYLAQAAGIAATDSAANLKDVLALARLLARAGLTALAITTTEAMLARAPGNALAVRLLARLRG
jgi:tetratricopeptide (TPR) repeat protein